MTASQNIFALTSEGRELEIIKFSEAHCKAFSHSGNAYPMLQSEADRQGLKIEKRDLRFVIVGVGWKSSWLEIEELYSKYMRDPIVWILTEFGEYNYDNSGRCANESLPLELCA